MKKIEFELTDGVYERWLEYKRKNSFQADIGALYKLLETSPPIAYTEKDILSIVYSAVWTIVGSAMTLTEEMGEIEDTLEIALCSCEECQKGKYAAHLNNFRFINVSRKRFVTMLQPNFRISVGLIDLMDSILHEVLHAIFPKLSEQEIIQKTQQVWLKGVENLTKKVTGEP
jgi:hypothetical protein